MKEYIVTMRVEIIEHAKVPFSIVAQNEEEAIAGVKAWEGEEMDEYDNVTMERSLLDPISVKEASNEFY